MPRSAIAVLVLLASLAACAPVPTPPAEAGDQLGRAPAYGVGKKEKMFN